MTQGNAFWRPRVQCTSRTHVQRTSAGGQTHKIGRQGHARTYRDHTRLYISGRAPIGRTLYNRASTCQRTQLRCVTNDLCSSQNRDRANLTKTSDVCASISNARDSAARRVNDWTLPQRFPPHASGQHNSRRHYFRPCRRPLKGATSGPCCTPLHPAIRGRHRLFELAADASFAPLPWRASDECQIVATDTSHQQLASLLECPCQHATPGILGAHFLQACSGRVRNAMDVDVRLCCLRLGLPRGSGHRSTTRKGITQCIGCLGKRMLRI